MEKIIKGIKEKIRDRHASGIAQTLKEHGFKAYFVGGCVRDILLGHTPKDIDIATDARPDDVQRLFRRTIAVGKQFGVIIVIAGGRHYEVATFRKDEGYEDGRHPSGVIFSTEKEDVLRRDFTINGLLYDPQSAEVIDYVGGREDLKNRVIRTIGNPAERFTEDTLRILRGIRFAARFDFSIEEETWKAIKSMASLVTRCSPERIREELSRILTGDNPDKGIRLCRKAGLLAVILPEVDAMAGVEQPPNFHPEGDVFEHTMLMLSLMKPGPSPEIAFAVLLHDVGKPPTFRVSDRIRFNNHDDVGTRIAADILTRLRFSNEEKEHILELIANHMRFIFVHQMKKSKLKRFLRLDRFEDHLELHRLDCLGSHHNLDNYHFCKEKIAEFESQEEELSPPPLINGKTLIGMGYKPGPLFKDILTRVEDLQLEGSLSTKEEAIAFVTEHYPQGDKYERH